MFTNKSKVRIYVKELLHKSDTMAIMKEFSEKTKVPLGNIKVLSDGTANVSDKIQENIVKSLNDDINHSDVYKEYLSGKQYNEELFHQINKEISLETDVSLTERHNYNLKYISGYNLTSYGEFTLDFSEYVGTTSLSSKPGNFGGKSNLYNLIQILLWGKYLSLDEYSNLPDIFNDYINDKYAYIEGTIELNDENYYVRREFIKETKKRVKHNLFLYKIAREEDADKYVYTYDRSLKEIDRRKYNPSLPDGLFVKSLNKQAIEQFQQSIGKIEDFIKICLFNHTTLYSLLLVGKTERTRNFYNLFGGEYYEKKKEIAKNKYSEFKKTAALHSVNLLDLETELSETERLLAERKNELSLLNDELTHQKDTISLLEEEKRIKLKSLIPLPNDAEIEQLNEKKEKLKDELITLNEDLSQLKKEIAGINFLEEKNISDLKKEHSFLVNELTNLKEPPALVKDKELTETTIETINNAMKSEQDSLRAIQAEKNEIKNNFEYNKKEMLFFENEIKTIPDNIICNKCDNVVVTHEDKKNRLFEKISLLKKDNISLKNKAEEILIKENNVLTKIKTLETDKEAKILYKNKIIGEIKSLFDNKRQELNKSINENLVLQNKTEILYKKQDKIESLETFFNSKKEELNIIEQQLLSINKNYGDALINNENVNKEIKRIDEKIKENNGIYHFCLEKRGNLTQRIKSFEELIQKAKKKIDSFQEDIELDKAYQFYIETHDMNGIVKFIIESYLNTINNELFSLTSHMNFKVEIYLDRGKFIDYKFTRDGEERSLKKVSGCERYVALAALYLIYIKFSRINLPNIVLFDEVFDQVANENIEDVYEIFKLYGEVFNHVFIIFHDSRLGEYTDSHITITKENNISKIS